MALFKYTLASALCLFSSADGRTPVMDSRHAAEALNAAFVAESGVVIRALHQWAIGCGNTSDCHEGNADCIMSAASWSLSSSVDKHTKKFTGNPLFGMGAVAFNTTTVEQTLAKCYWATDANTNYRYDGGCGCLVSQQDKNCESPHSAHQNRAPNGDLAFGDNPYVSSCRCKGHPQEEAEYWMGESNAQCFYRGPAFEERQGHYFGGSELGQMYKLQALIPDMYKLRAHIPGVGNEIVLDSGRVSRMLSEDPGAAIVAILLPDFWPRKAALEFATTLQSTFKAMYKVEFPIVHQGFDVEVSREQGPFFEYNPQDRDLLDTKNEAVIV